MLRLCLITPCVIAVLIQVANRTAAEDVNAVAGVYFCEGVNPDGQPYTALLEVVPSGEHVWVRWTFRDDPPLLGIGVLRDGVLAITYSNRRAIGLVLYHIHNDSITRGEWITPGGHGVWRESLTKVPDDHVPTPTYPWPSTAPASHTAMTL